jgi:O-antigen/teichoic acid export membrane protein
VNLSAFHWLQIGTQRHYAEYESRGQQGELGGTIAAFYIAFAVTVMLIAIGLGLLLPRAAGSQNIFVATALLILVMPAFENSLAIVIAKGSARMYGFLSSTKAILALVSAVTLIVWFSASASSALYGLCVGLVCASWWYGSVGWLLANVSKASLACARTLLRYGAPLAVSLVLSLVAAAGDRLLIGVALGAEATGLYAAGYDIAYQVLGVAMGTVAIAITPTVYRTYASAPAEVSKQLHVLLALQLTIALPIVVAAFLAPREIALLLLGSEYADSAAKVIPLIAAAAFMNYLRAHYFDLAFHLALRIRPLVFVLFCVAALNLASNVFFVPRYGVAAAGWTAIGCYGLGVLLSIGIGATIRRIPLWNWGACRALFGCAGMIMVFSVLGRLTDINWALKLVAALIAYALIVGSVQWSTAVSFARGHCEEKSS